MAPSEIELWVCCRGGVTSMLAGAHVFDPIPAVVVSFFGGVISLLAHRQLAWSHTIDDVVSSMATNLISGTWAMLSVGLFAATSFVAATSSSHDQSLLETGTFDLMWKQAAVLVAEVFLSGISTLATLGFVRIFVPSLRSSLKVEGQSLNLVRKLHFREVVGSGSHRGKLKGRAPADHDKYEMTSHSVHTNNEMFHPQPNHLFLLFFHSLTNAGYFVQLDSPKELKRMLSLLPRKRQ
jgi:hypothetical protein